MIFYRIPEPTKVSEMMRLASARTGFSLGEIEEMVASDLETPHLLDYITAVMSGRMN